MVCKHYVQAPLLVYLLAVVEVELPNQFLVVAEAINPIPSPSGETFMQQPCLPVRLLRVLCIFFSYLLHMSEKSSTFAAAKVKHGI